MTCFKFDLAIVGSGVMGLCAALEEIRRSAGARVVILDRMAVAVGQADMRPAFRLLSTNRDGASPRAARDAYLGDTIPGRILPGRV